MHFLSGLVETLSPLRGISKIFLSLKTKTGKIKFFLQSYPIVALSRGLAREAHYAINSYHTWFDILPLHGQILISVSARLLVPETDGVHNLMQNDAFTVTSNAYGDFLFTRNRIFSANFWGTTKKVIFKLSLLMGSTKTTQTRGASTTSTLLDDVGHIIMLLVRPIKRHLPTKPLNSHVECDKCFKVSLMRSKQ